MNKKNQKKNHKKNKMMKNSVREILRLVMVLTLVGITAMGYGQTDKENLDTINIEVVTEYTPTISDAFKKNDNPKVIDTVPFEPKLNYSIQSKKITSDFELVPIKPAKIKGEPLSKLYRAYLKVGYGTQSRFYGEGFFNELRSKKHSWGAHVVHHSSAGKIKDVGPSNYGDTKINLYGKKFLKKHTLSGEFNFTNSYVHRYGFDTTDSLISNLDDSIIGKDAIKQRFNLIGGNARLLSHYRDSAMLNHDITIRYHNLADLYNTSENNVVLHGSLNRYLDAEFLEVTFAIDYMDVKYNANSDSSSLLSSAIINLHPSVSTSGDKYKFIIGISAYMDRDNTYGAFYNFYPSVYFSYSLVVDLMIPYCGIVGVTKRNSFKSFSDENPFIVSNPEINNTKHPIQFYGGLKGKISSTSSFNISASRDKINNAAFFVNDTLNKTDTLGNRFAVVYDDVKYFNLHGEVSYQYREKLKLLLQGDYFSYTMDLEDKAWHKPIFEISLSAVYNLREKIIAKADFFVFGSQYARGFEADGRTVKPIKLDGAADINLALEYRYTKKLSAFLNLNNIAAMRYNKWNQYPTQRFNLLGGLTYVF